MHNLWSSTEIGVQAVGCRNGDGLLAATAARVHSLITVALQVPPDLLLP